MKILMVINYYTPHVSGLTIYVKRIGEELARRGHQVTVLASHHLPSLPYRENINGVSVVRLPVLLRVNKGAVMPSLPWDAHRLVRQHDVVHLHLPMLESGFLAWATRAVARKKTVITYHCDIQLPRSPMAGIIAPLLKLSHSVAAAQADAVVTYTKDYAEHSAFLSRFRQKVSTVYPPIIVEPPDPKAVAAWRAELGLEGRSIVGFAGRFSEDKGGEYLLGSIPHVMAEVPDARYVFAGEYRNVIGENYFEKVRPIVESNRDHVLFLGELHGQRLSNFYSMCDLLTLPSINSTESFGMVQVEAMLCGTPVVASDIPGVREPVRVSGMGLVVPPRDARALGRGIVEVLRNRARYLHPKIDLAASFSVGQTVDFYEKLYFRNRVRAETSAFRPGRVSR